MQEHPVGSCESADFLCYRNGGQKTGGGACKVAQIQEELEQQTSVTSRRMARFSRGFDKCGEE